MPNGFRSSFSQCSIEISSILFGESEKSDSFVFDRVIRALSHYDEIYELFDSRHLYLVIFLYTLEVIKIVRC